MKLEHLVPNEVVDCIGESCPMPVVKASHAVKKAAPGHVLEVRASDRGAHADLRSFAGRLGHDYLGAVEELDHVRHFIKIAPKDEQIVDHPYPYTIHPRLIQEKKHKALIIDVREPEEFAKGHIEGAHNVPLGSLNHRVSELKEHQHEEIVVVCHSGRRSDLAAKTLSEEGFSRVKNMEGGMLLFNEVTEAPKTSERRVAIIAATGTLDTAYKALNIATVAASTGALVHVFFTFEGIDLICKDKLEHLPLSSNMAQYQEGFQQAKVPPIQEMYLLANQLGVQLIACNMTLEVMGLHPEDLVEGTLCAGAAHYLDFAYEAQVSLSF